MTLPDKIIAALVLILSLIAAFMLYGHSQYAKGYNQSNLEAKAAADDLNKKYRKKELDDQRIAKEKDDAYQHEKSATAAAAVALSKSNDSLLHSIASYRSRLSSLANSTGRTDDKGTVGIDLFAECSNRYNDMAKEAGRLADKDNALIDQLAIGR